MPISLGFWEWGFPKRGCHITVTPGLERYSLVPGFEQNTVRDSGSLWLGTGFDCFPGGGIRQNLGTNAVLGKRTISRDGGDVSSGRSILVKRSENAGSDPTPPPPPPPFSLLRPYNMDSLGTKIHLVGLFKSQLLNPSPSAPPPPPPTPLPPYRCQTWYFYQSSSFLMLLGCLRQNRYHRWEIFKVINTEYLYLC